MPWCCFLFWGGTEPDVSESVSLPGSLHFKINSERKNIEYFSLLPCHLVEVS